MKQAFLANCKLHMIKRSYVHITNHLIFHDKNQIWSIYTFRHQHCASRKMVVEALFLFEFYVLKFVRRRRKKFMENSSIFMKNSFSSMTESDYQIFSLLENCTVMPVNSIYELSTVQRQIQGKVELLCEDWRM